MLRHVCDDEPLCPGLVGDGAYGDGCIDVEKDLDAFEVAEGLECPALALFDQDTQGRRLVFRTKQPVLTAQECAAVLGEVHR